MKKLLIISIDGLSRTAFDTAVTQKQIPFVGSLLKKNWKLYNLYSGLPSTTPAGQMGILYGIDNLVMGFRCYLRDKKVIFNPVDPKTIPVMEKKAQTLAPHALGNIASCFAIYSANAATSFSLGSVSHNRMQVLTLIKNYSKSPSRVIFMLIQIIISVIVEYGEYRKVQKSTLPYKHRSFISTRLQHELWIQNFFFVMAAERIKKRDPIIFVNFSGYDDISHYYGPFSRSSLLALTMIDLLIKNLFEEVRQNKDEYEIVIISDHGQSDSLSFNLINGASLGDMIARIYNDKKIVEQSNARDGRYTSETDLLILDSGNLSLITDMKSDAGLNKEEFESSYTRFCERVSQFYGVEYVLARGKKGSVVTYAGKDYLLSDVRSYSIWMGNLAPSEWKRTVDQYEKLLANKNSVDIIIIGRILQNGKVISFEQFGGSHGGVGGNQVNPIFLSKSIQIPQDRDVTIAGIHEYLHSFVYSDTVSK